ncbi:substrate-binding domain-containing protein [candidate division KSB3 bacterium]|uniref:Substrate-binding domain-containing protein n=1 Tax=candidate division KSB3 bacterium TaxID=2044937 RepID=A0A9D5JS43_9BACT|nr:substrate-binding domain-containing protein [candidate division KSB3 bacterium]
MKKSIRITLLMVVAVTLVVGSGSLFAADEQYTMMSIPKLRATWFDRMEVGLKKAGEEYGIDVSQQAPAAADEAQQVRLIEDAINQGNDAILVVPNDANSIVPAFSRAQRQNIVTITHESPQQQNADFDIEMIDNVAFGEKAMELFVENMGATAGKYVVFVGSLTVPAHNIWADAAIALAEEKYPGMEQVADRYPVSEDQNAARQAALDIITAHPDIKGFLCFGSQGAPGAAQAVREKGLIGKMTVIGTTSPSQASKYLKDGSFNAAILWDPAEAGYAMVYLAKLVLDGKKSDINADLDIPTLGKPLLVEGNTLVYDRPLIITKDNVDDYSGF